MTQEKMSPLRERMIPSHACKHALPGSGRHAHPRDGRQSPEGAHSGGQGFCRVPEALAGHRDTG